MLNWLWEAEASPLLTDCFVTLLPFEVALSSMVLSFGFSMVLLYLLLIHDSGRRLPKLTV